ncbi:hypothetical protein HII28_17785 [Planctomonas sp. JC2975]|uniref:hypothetical protein n=1 Tax=Planctomonas sp. JC2975 TaxID=2729626 RepID=UPI0014728D9C|nr:hypothetical protein [Planctomonas sp. JC2975]NNC13719.1 hypothetical protein [Planctomonas sp. JC2975]
MTTESVEPSRTRDLGRRAIPLVVVNFVLCLALVAQFLLGMVANLFVTVPTHHPGANASDYYAGVVASMAWLIPHGEPWLVAHAVVGLVLVVAAIVNLVWMLRLRSALYATASILGALATLGAGFNGASFVIYGFDSSSMIMSGLWALAMCCYLVCLLVAARRGVRAKA